MQPAGQVCRAGCMEDQTLKNIILIDIRVFFSGERLVFKDGDVSVPTGLSLNGRIFVSPKEHQDALVRFVFLYILNKKFEEPNFQTCLPDQETPTEGLVTDLELFSTKELAYHMTLFDWSLFCAVHEVWLDKENKETQLIFTNFSSQYELIYHTFGRHHFHKITSNLDVFLRRFNEIQFWVVSELCLTPTVSRRVQLVRKFIKLAA